MLFDSYICRHIFDIIIEWKLRKTRSAEGHPDGVPDWIYLIIYGKRLQYLPWMKRKVCFVFLFNMLIYSTLSLIDLKKLSWILNNFCSQQVTEIHNNCSAFQILLQISHIFQRFRWRTWWKLLNWIAAVQLKHSFTFLAKERVTIVTCCKVWLTQGHTYMIYIMKVCDPAPLWKIVFDD